jgi:hypothetical protein
MTQANPAGFRLRLGALAMAFALAAEPALGQTLMCQPTQPKPSDDLPAGSMLVLVIDPSGAQLHGCIADACQPVTDGLAPSAITDEEITLADGTMGIDVHIMRTRRPLEMRVDTRKGDATASIDTRCSVQ